MKCAFTGSNNAASNYHDLEPTRLRLSFFRFISQLQSIYSPPVMKQDLYLYVWSLLYLSQESRCSCFHGFSFLIRQLHRALSAWSIFRSRRYTVISASHQRRRKTPLIVTLWPQIVRPNSLDIHDDRVRRAIELSVPIVRVSGSRSQDVGTRVPRDICGIDSGKSIRL